MIILKHAKFISDGRIFKAGDIIPDTAITRGLVEKGLAEIVNGNKPAKKSKAETPPENNEVNT